MSENNQFSITSENLRSIFRGALINLSGTVLLSIGVFLQGTAFSVNDFRILGFALLSNLGAVIVNTVRKFLEE